MRVHGQLQVWCRIRVLDRVECGVRVMVMVMVMVTVTVRVWVGPRRLRALNPQQSGCLPKGLSGLHKEGCRSGLVLGFLGQTDIWAPLKVGLRNPLM